MAQTGADVTVVVDRSQANSTSDVREALRKLEAAGVKIQS